MTDLLDRAYECLQQGALESAERHCRSALARNVRDSAAWTMLGMVHRQQGQYADAESAYRRSIAINPRDAYARHNLGAMLSQLDRAEDALIELNSARSLGLRARELHVNRGRTLLQLYRLEEAESDYRQAVKLDPKDASAQSSLASLLHMRGDPDFLQEMVTAARDHPNDARLHLSLSETQRRAGSLESAAATLRRLRERLGPFPELSRALASLLLEMGNLEEARREASLALQTRKLDAAVVDINVAISLAGQQPEKALELIRPFRSSHPLDQRWIAYEATAERLLGSARYRRLYDYGRLVQVYELIAPQGYSSMDNFNRELEAALLQRHPFASHPLEQSLRQGTQTARNLLTETTPVIRSLMQSFAEPLAHYAETIAADPEHPMHRDGAGKPTILGCWSVCLRGGGYHVNHVHPQGWISSAYYVSVPPSTSDERRKDGWIKFGEPGVPIAGLGAEHFVQPRPGRLVLFPSYLWHGTNRINDDERRLSVAFDAVPP